MSVELGPRTFTVAVCGVAALMTILVGHWAQKAPTHQEFDATQVVPGVVSHLMNGHGCPVFSLNLNTIECDYDGWSIKMELRCKTTAAELSTDMIHGVSGARSQFETVMECNDASIVRWEGTDFVFGVRDLKIEAFSRDMDEVVGLMCPQAPDSL